MTPVVLIFGQSNGGNLHGSNSFQNALDDAGGDAILLNSSLGGSSVAKYNGAWNIIQGDGEDALGIGYTGMLDGIDNMLANTPDAYIAGAIWVQGESDTFGGSELDYYTPTRALFEAVYDHIGEDVQTYVVGLSDYHGLPNDGVETVRSQQQQLANDMENVEFISTDDIIAKYDLSEDEAMRDNLHYSDTFLEHLSDEILEQSDLRANLGLRPLEAPILQADPEPEPQEPASENSQPNVVVEEQVAQPIIVEDPAPQPVQLVEEEATPQEPVLEEPQVEAATQTEEPELEPKTEEPILEVAAEVVQEIPQGDQSVREVHEQAASETVDQVEDTSTVDEAPTEAAEDDAGAQTGIMLGLSAIGAAMGIFFLPLLGLLGLLGLSKSKNDEDGPAEVAQQPDGGTVLSDVIPTTEVIAESTMDTLELDDQSEIDLLLL